MIFTILIASILTLVAILTDNKTIRNVALCGAALVGVGIALKIFIHAITWALGALLAIALIVVLVWFAIKNRSK